MINRRQAIWLSMIVSQGLFLALILIWMKLLNYLNPVVLLVVWCCFTIFIVSIILLLTNHSVFISRKVLLVVLLLYSCCLLVLLFFRPSNQAYQTVNLIPFKTITYYLTGDISFLIAFYNLAANVLLFVPFGVFTLLKKRNMPVSKIKMFVIPIVVIILIEVMQFLTARGSMDVDDLILNVLGVYSGYSITPLVKRVLKFRESL